MARFGFVGPSYTSQSVNADCQVCRNWYPESIESQQGKSGFALYPTPGLAVFCTLTDSPLRGLFTINGRAFAVAGSTFFELLTNGTAVNRGAVANDGLMASITGGPLHILVASGGIGYAFTLATNAFIAPANMVNPVQVAYSDGYFIALKQNSDVFQFSTLLDATTWSLADVEQVNFYADNVISMHVDHREICLFGAKQSIVYANSGDPNTPFLPINGAFAEQGSGAIFGNTKLDNTSFWIGINEHGAGVGWRAQGYTPVRVTTHAIELAWQGYPTIADAVSYSYQDQGHAFWVVYFPSANSGRGATWVFDVATSLWHERDFLANGIHYAHRSNCHTYAFGKHLVGDWNSGNVYQMAIPVSNGAGDWSFADDFGNPIERVRRAPHVSKEQEWQIHNSIQVDVEAGLGPIPPLSNMTTATLIESSGGSGVLKYQGRFLVHTTIGDSYNATGTFNNVGSTSVVIRLTLTGVGTLSTTIAPGVTEVISLGPLTGNNNNGFLEIASVNIGDSFSVIGMNPYVEDTTAAPGVNTFTGGSLLFTTNWSAQGGATITLTQNQSITGVQRSPQISLRWSDDGGHAWSNQYSVTAGAAGNYKTRAIWRRLGRSRDRVYEVQVSDPIPWRIVDAYLKADPDYRPTERLVKTVSKGA